MITSHPLTTGLLTIIDNDIMNTLDKYNSSLILIIEGSFKPPYTQYIYPPRQPQHPNLAHAAASVTITAIDNSYSTTQWMDLPTIPLLSHVHPLPATYGTNNVTNNTPELLARIMTYKFLPVKTLAIIVYDSVVVHIQHLALLGHTYTNKQRTRTVFFGN